MPAKSKVMRRAMSIALHHPEQLYARNAGLKSMSLKQLAEYASTSEKDLPAKKRKKG